MMPEEMGLLLVVYAMVAIVYGALFIVLLGSYIFQSIAFFSIAKKRQIKHAWLSWIPVASQYILGSIVDDFDYEEKGIDKKWRKTLLTLVLVVTGGYAIAFVGYFAAVFGMVFAQGDEALAILFIVLFVIFYVMILLVAAVAMGSMACQMICMYKIFDFIAPEKSVKYILLHTMVPLAGPICLFKCRKLVEEKTDMEEIEE